MPDLDELRRTFTRIESLPDFRADQRIWWIYMRNAAIELASRHPFPDLDRALRPIKDMPERSIDERRHWLALREVIALLLEQAASE